MNNNFQEYNEKEYNNVEKKEKKKINLLTYAR